MNSKSVISKKMVIVYFILLLSILPICIVAGYKQEFIFLIVVWIITSWFIQLRYFKCSNCEVRIDIWSVLMRKHEYCPKCGIKIDIE